MNLALPASREASLLRVGARRLFIGAYGFERRSLGWARSQRRQGAILSRALVFRYIRPKGRNRIRELQAALRQIGIGKPLHLIYEVDAPGELEPMLEDRLGAYIADVDEIIIDISAMTKLLSLVLLCLLKRYDRTLRIVYSEAIKYAPTRDEYVRSRSQMEWAAKFPSRGIEEIVRTKCLSSVVTQGQPVTLIAFTSFNEQLVRHMLGSISPHRLVFINGRPPRKENLWRAEATQELHRKLVEAYAADNPFDRDGHLANSASTLDYRETVMMLVNLYRRYGAQERMLCAATGSKMQTVGLFVAKMIFRDIHVEYPTPDSYFVKGLSQGIWRVHEVVFPSFAKVIEGVRQQLRP